MKVLDLFSGIGGFSLGLQWAGGFTTEQFVEIDPYCRRVLTKHWPEVPVHDDINTYHGERGRFDVVTGGFPCQDISLAGRGAGIEGERSGLWKQLARVIGEVGPRWAIIENVPALRSRGLVTVLQDICALGYDAEWHCVPASALGARHRRDRIWIVAYPNSESQRNGPVDAEVASPQKLVSNTHCPRLAKRQVEHARQECTTPQRSGAVISDTAFKPLGGAGQPWQADDYWKSEPDVGRVAHGIPARVDRLRALGEAIVPQKACLIGRAILEAEREPKPTEAALRSLGSRRV